jgi:hypothetical protein
MYVLFEVLGLDLRQRFQDNVSIILRIMFMDKLHIRCGDMDYVLD